MKPNETTYHATEKWISCTDIKKKEDKMGAKFSSIHQETQAYYVVARDNNKSASKYKN